MRLDIMLFNNSNLLNEYKIELINYNCTLNINMLLIINTSLVINKIKKILQFNIILIVRR